MTSLTNQTISTTVDNIVATNPLSESNYWSTQQVLNPSATATSTPVQSTTLKPVTGQNFVSDVSISAYMRGNDIDFVCYNMRPNRKVQIFFDGKDVSKLVQQPNIVKIDNNLDLQSLLPRVNQNTSNVNANGTIVGPVDTSQEMINIGGGQARVLYTKKDTDGNTILYISEIQQANSQLDWANNNIVVQSQRTGAIANIVSIQQRSGYIKKASKITEYDNVAPVITATQDQRYYVLDAPFMKSSNEVAGKTITILNGKNPGETVEILSYTRANGEIYVSNDFTNFVSTANLIYSIDNVDMNVNPQFTTTVGAEQIFHDPGKPDVIQTTGRSSGQFYTDDRGVLVGTIRIPDPKLVPEYRFKVGEKLLRVIDDSQNDPENATTIAEFNFVAFGLNLSTTQIVIKTPTGQINVGNTTISNVNPGFAGGSPVIFAPVDPSQTPINVESYSPLAQSFYISPLEYPKGFFTPYVDLFFANKGTLPIELQIRPMKNGFPDSTNILPNAIAYLDADDVKVTTNPNANDSNSYTRFTFTSPVFLQPEQEYALVVKTNDFDYDIYVSELGQTMINSNRLVSQQPYSGVLFKSQNSSTYSDIQDEDLMFVIHKCQFATAGTIFFNEYKDVTYVRPIEIGNFTSNTVVDAFEVHSDSIELLGTSINYSYRATSNTTKTIDASYTNFKADKITLVPDRKIIYGPDHANESFEMRLDLLTTSPDVSPIVYKNKQSISAIQTYINNMSIDPLRITVANTGNGYTTQNTTVTFSANSGQGANAVVITQVEPTLSGKVYTLAFDGNGYGYYDDVSVNISTTDANASGAVVNVLSETGKAGGPAQARYVSKTVTLAPEFDAGDLRVYLTAVRPREADIQVYYKVRNNFDNENINDKNWVRMKKVTGTFEYSTELEEIEMEFRPSMNSNTIIYSTNTATFDTFNQFKIKIVMASSDTVLQKIPYVYDMRAIALPGDV